MADTTSGEHLKIWTPGTYRISVEGQLDEKWSERLAGMDIKSRKRPDQSVVTTLSGNVQDQSELLGVLNSLYELHLPILSVKILAENNGDPPNLDKPAKRKGGDDGNPRIETKKEI